MMLKILVLFVMIFASPVFAEEIYYSPEWVTELEAAQDADQLAIVCGTRGSNARFSLHVKDPETEYWLEVLSCPAYIGKEGWGKEREGDMKTPRGIYSFTRAFGIKEDPGSVIDYTKVNKYHYWVGDSDSDVYNQLISVKEYDLFDRKASEHIIDYKTAYKYCLNINYNEDGEPGKGSAIFLHCQTKNRFTAGCVAIPEEAMIKVLRTVNQDCVLIMDENANIKDY